MPIDVGDGQLNLILNGCLFGMIALAAITLCPWPLGGGRNRWALWLPVVAVALYAAYEAVMPANFNIRVDLFLVWPLLLLVLLGWVFRLGAIRLSKPGSMSDQG